MKLQPEEDAVLPGGARRAAQGAGWLDEPFKLGRYGVFGRIANGGMAEVLLALQGDPEGIQRLVAIKRILPHLAQNQDFVSMMIDEARLAARIRHVNVVQVHDYLVRQGQPHIVMEYLPGITLSDLLRKMSEELERPEPTLAAYIIAEAAKGLHSAHELRAVDGTPLDVVHRDVSPDNLFMTIDGSIKVLDFGIAKAARRLTQTEHGQLKGRLRYMSPEQIAGKPLDRRSDIYSLGVVLAETATGRRFFANSDPTLAADERLDPETPDGLEDFPELERIVRHATQRRPRDRYSSIEAMRLELETFILEHAATGLDRDVARAVAEVAPGSERWEQSIHEHGTKVRFPQSAATDGVEAPAQPVSHKKSTVAFISIGFAAVLALAGVLVFNTPRDEPVDPAPLVTTVSPEVPVQEPEVTEPDSTDVEASPNVEAPVVEEPVVLVPDAEEPEPRRRRISMRSVTPAVPDEEEGVSAPAEEPPPTMRPDWNVYFTPETD
ncbi:MAG: serine/threonine protein kinase [Polyangiales bacterium]|jgi:serine/threonine protein kinase